MHRQRTAALFFFSLFVYLFQLPASRAQQKERQLSVADSASFFQNHNYFIVGEFHDYLEVPPAKLELIKYLAAHKGVRHVFMEIGRAAASLYNSYLQTGDTSFISKPPLAYNTSAADKEFWKQLYEYNATLDAPIVIHGMDFERLEFLKVMRMLKSGTKDLGQTPFLRKLDTLHLATVNSTDLEGPLAEARADLARTPELYAALYGDNLAVIKYMLANENTYAKYKLRNKAMHKNVMQEVAQDSINSFVLFAGMNHTNAGDKNTLGAMLANDKYLHGEVANIAMLCKNCTTSKADAREPAKEFDGPVTYKDNTALMKRLFTDLPATIESTIRVGDKQVEKYSDWVFAVLGE